MSHQNILRVPHSVKATKGKLSASFATTTSSIPFSKRPSNVGISTKANELMAMERLNQRSTQQL